MKIGTESAVDQFAESEGYPVEDDFQGPLVEKSAVFCLFIAIVLLAFSAASLIR